MIAYRKLWRWTLGVSVMLPLILAGCAPAATPVASPTAAAQPAATVAAQPAATVAAWPGAKLTVAEHGLVSNAPLYVALEKGYFQEQGLEIEFTRMQGGGEMMAPLASNQIDVAIGAPGAGLFNAITRDIPIRIVADKGSDFKGRGFAALVVRKDLIDSGAVRDYADLKGKRFTMASKAGANELDLVRALEKGGLTLEDVQVETLPYPEMMTALANKSIDGGILVEPFVAQAVGREVGVRWRGVEDFYPGAMRGVLMYGPRLVAQDKEAGTRFMVAYLKGARDYMDAFEKGIDKETIIAALIKHTAVKDRALYDRMDPAGINRNGYLDIQDLEYQQDYYVRSGYQQAPIDMREAVDHSFIDRALSVIGRQ